MPTSRPPASQFLLDLGRLLDFQCVALHRLGLGPQTRRRSQVVDSATSDMSMHMLAESYYSDSDDYLQEAAEEEEVEERLADEQDRQAVAAAVSQPHGHSTAGAGTSAAAAGAVPAGDVQHAAPDTSCMTDDSAYLVDGPGLGPHPWLSLRWADHVQSTAQRLLQVVCRRGLSHTATWLLDLLHAQGCDPAEVVKVRCMGQPGLRLPSADWTAGVAW